MISHRDYTPDDYPYTVAPPRGGNPLLLLPPLAALLISGMLILIVGRLTIAIPEPATAPVQQSDPGPAAALAPLFTPEVQHWSPQIVEWAQTWELDANLVATVMQIESCGDPQARSHAGATGLFQVMPFHFAELEDPYHPDTNAKRGLNYLTRSLNSFNGDVRLALAGYNAGITGAGRGEARWPAETLRYTRWGTGIYNDALAGRHTSATLTEWLGRGGASLCKQAATRLGLK